MFPLDEPGIRYINKQIHFYQINSINNFQPNTSTIFLIRYFQKKNSVVFLLKECLFMKFHFPNPLSVTQK